MGYAHSSLARMLERAPTSGDKLINLTGGCQTRAAETNELELIRHLKRMCVGLTQFGNLFQVEFPLSEIFRVMRLECGGFIGEACPHADHCKRLGARLLDTS
jgi:hypothetical protein